MAKIVRIKNTGTTGIWVGQQLAQDVYFTIDNTQRQSWADDSQVYTDVIAGTLVVNDGSSDFSTPIEGWSWLRSHTDNQIITGTAETSTTSVTFIDLPGMTLTTVNDNGLDYFVLFKGDFKCSVKGNTVAIRLVINGTPVDHTVREFTAGGNNYKSEISTQDAGVLGTGVVIKVQWSTTGGTGFCYGRSLLIQSS